MTEPGYPADFPPLTPLPPLSQEYLNTATHMVRGQDLELDDQSLSIPRSLFRGDTLRGRVISDLGDVLDRYEPPKDVEAYTESPEETVEVPVEPVDAPEEVPVVDVPLVSEKPAERPKTTVAKRATRVTTRRAAK